MHNMNISNEHNESLMSDVVAELLKYNPTMKLGDRMTAPINLVDSDGKITFPETGTVTSAYSRMFKSLSDLNVENKELENKYLHPYKCTPHFCNNKVGDIIQISDLNTFWSVDIIVTQEIIDKNTYVIFRFGTSDIT